MVVSSAIPFLFIREIYSVCSAFSALPSFGPDGPAAAQGTLAAFSVISGKWELYLGMSFLMELVVVLMYLVYGLTHRKEEGYDDVVPTDYPLESVYKGRGHFPRSEYSGP